MLCFVVVLLNPFFSQKTIERKDTSKLDITWLNLVEGKMITSQFKKTEVIVKVSTRIESQIKRFFSYSKDSILNGINPLSKQDIEVKLTITSDGQFVQQVDGFYFQNSAMLNEQRFNEFRFRFSIPYTVGSWKAKIELIMPNKPVLKDSLLFKVARSSENGYVEKGRYPNSYRFSRSEETCIPIFLDIKTMSPRCAQLAMFSSIIEKTDTLFNDLEITKLADFLSQLNTADSVFESLTKSTDFVSLELINHQLITATLKQLEANLTLENLPQFKANFRNYLRYISSRFGHSSKLFDFVIYNDIEKIILLDILGENINQNQELEWLVNLTKYLKEECNVRQMIAVKDQSYNENDCTKELIAYPMVDLIRLPYTSNSMLKRIEKKNILYEYNPLNSGVKVENLDSLCWMNFYANLGDFTLVKNGIFDTLLGSLEIALKQLKLQKYDFTNKSFYQEIHKLEMPLKSNKSLAGFSQLDESQSFGFGYVKQVQLAKTKRKLHFAFKHDNPSIHIKLKKLKKDKVYEVSLFNTKDNFLVSKSIIRANLEGDLLVEFRPLIGANRLSLYFVVSEVK